MWARPNIPRRRPLLRFADRFAGDDELDAAVHLAARGGAVGRNRTALAVAGGGDDRLTDVLLHQIGAHRFGTALRQPLVVVVGSGAVGVTLDLDLQIGMRG